MSLSNLIRRKSEPVGFATATPATFATQEGKRGRTVASVATVAVANSPQEQTAPPAKVSPRDTVEGLRLKAAVDAGLKLKPTYSPAAPLTAEEETAIRAWLALIEETDPATLAEVIGRCQRDADARDYFTARAAAELPKPDPFPDDRRCCSQCLNLASNGRCLAAARRDIIASRTYAPAPDLLRRCEGFKPLASDPDQRPGRDRWPGL